MRLTTLVYVATTALLVGCGGGKQQSEQHAKNELRAPAYPLVTIDPYTSAWSMSNQLYDAPVKHWTGKNFPLLGVAKVDGKAYRFMGEEELELYPICGTSEQCDWEGKYTTAEPVSDWEKAGFNDAAWKTAPGAFGTKENEPTAKTQWGSEYIWVRRTVNITDDLSKKNLYLEYSHDDDVIIYVNGIKVVETGNSAKKYVYAKLPEEAVASLKKGENIIAAYCRNRVGNGLLDFGLLAEKDDTRFFAETAVQTSVDAQATQTYYTFNCGNVDLKLTFTAPLLMDDLDLMTRPVNYLTYEVQSKDNQKHDVELYFEAGPQWAIDQPYQKSVSKTGNENGIVYASTGSVEQNILAKRGDDLRIDWGYFYFAAPDDNRLKVGTGDGALLRQSFLADGTLKEQSTDGMNKLAIACKMGNVKSDTGYLMLAYDDIYSLQYFGTNLRPYWNRKNDQTIFTQLEKATQEYSTLMKRCTEFDAKLIGKAEQAGGRKYAELCALAYRQVMAAHKLVESPDGELLFMSKENFSNGCINTVDLTYPSSPLFLVYNPNLLKGMMNGIFQYSESGKWPKPFAAHDLGTYPLANGQVYGGDMPIEETGNMMILSAAIAVIEGNPDYAAKHWDVLTTWVNYLAENGLDPENQLCTDDFAGHFAHNTNLSIKAIMGVASYAYLADKQGMKDISNKYMEKAKEMAGEWLKMADDGDHYRLTFDKPGTWSLKYNLVWDELLGFNLFPREVVEKELAYYQTKENKYGVPLDNRETYTKNDWIMWTATMAQDRATFEKFIAPIYTFMNETVDRVPMTDWNWTLEPNQRGFQARSVIGGYWMKVLKDKLGK